MVRCVGCVDDGSVVVNADVGCVGVGVCGVGGIVGRCGLCCVVVYSVGVIVRCECNRVIAVRDFVCVLFAVFVLVMSAAM